MHFFKLVTLASFAIAAPAPNLEKRQQTTPIDAIAKSVNILSSAVLSNSDSINSLAQSVADNVDATAAVKIEAALKANLNNIASALTTATNSITGVTTGAVGGIAKQAQGLTQSQIDSLSSSLNTVVKAVSGIGTSVNITTAGLTPAIRDIIHGEADGVKQAINPLLTPILGFAVAARSLAGAGINVTGLGNAVQSSVSAVQSLVSNLGIPVIGLPSIPGLPGILGVPGVNIVV